MKRLPLAATLVLLASALSAQTALAPISPAVRAQVLPLPAETNIVALNPSDLAHPKVSYTIRRTFAADGTFTVEWSSAHSQARQTFRPDGTLLASKETNFALQRTVETTSDPARTQVRTVVTVKGEQKSDKTQKLIPGVLVKDELENLVVQAWAYGVRDGLKLQSLSPDGGLVGDFEVVYRQNVDPLTLSDQYAFPAEFKAALGGRRYTVADMRVTGIGGMFFPHHFYLVYRNTPSGLVFAAYFGEDPKAATYQYAVN